MLKTIETIYVTIYEGTRLSGLSGNQEAHKQRGVGSTFISFRQNTNKSLGVK